MTLPRRDELMRLQRECDRARATFESESATLRTRTHGFGQQLVETARERPLLAAGVGLGAGVLAALTLRVLPRGTFGIALRSLRGPLTVLAEGILAGTVAMGGGAKEE